MQAVTFFVLQLQAQKLIFNLAIQYHKDFDWQCDGSIDGFASWTNQFGVDDLAAGRCETGTNFYGGSRGSRNVSAQ
jgi:hypothetical protein